MRKILALLLFALLLTSCTPDSDSLPDGIGTERQTPTVIPDYYIDSFACSTSGEGLLTFSWKVVSDFERITVSISSTDGSFSLNEEITDPETLSLSVQGEPGKIYRYSFTPYSASGEAGKEYCGTCYIPSSDFRPSLSYIVITTMDNEIPDCDLVDSPEGAFGSGIVNNDYVYAEIELHSADGELLYSTRSDNKTLQGFESKIKVRGNTSAYDEKIPYKIKLAKKTDLLRKLGYSRKGDQFKDKEWLLMKCGTDINNVIGFAVNEHMKGISYTPAYEYVELFINGDYRGVYMLVESIKQGNTDKGLQARCQVDDDGFVIENDPYWWNEGLYFKTGVLDSEGHAYTFKYPDADDITISQILYIKDYVGMFEKHLILESPSYLDYIDLDSFVSWVMVHEYIGAHDAGGSNQYLIKKDSSDSSKLEMTTTWDFDWIMHEQDENTHANINRLDFFVSNRLLSDPTFHSACEQKYRETRNSIIDKVNEKISMLDADAINSARQSDAMRWSTEYSTVEAQQHQINSWLESRLSWMDSEYRY